MKAVGIILGCCALLACGTPEQYAKWKPLLGHADVNDVREKQVPDENEASGSANRVTANDTSIEDIGKDPYIFESTSLPASDRLLPSVGNGHLATNVYGDAVYVNGLYNGRLGLSHRARVPAVHASRLHIDGATNTSRHYALHTAHGMFEEVISSHEATVTFRTYAHSFFNRILVTEIHIMKHIEGNVSVYRESLAGEDSVDFTWNAPEAYNATFWRRDGVTLEKELDEQDARHVHVYWEDAPAAWINVTGPAGERAVYTYLLAVDDADAPAKQHFDMAQAYLPDRLDELRSLHTDNWRHLWDSGHIEVETDDLELKKAIAGSFYYLYSSLPSPNPATPSNQFYGLSPGGLANGKNGSDYYGHVFWDMETWMYPPVLLFQPAMGEAMLSYRIHGMQYAFERAFENGHRGARFPWESAYTGVEVTPDICPACRDNQQHITGDIAYAARQYLAATGDIDWLHTKRGGAAHTGGDFVHEMGHFWYSRPTWNTTKDRYEIKGVMPPDEHQEEVDNSVYTNLGAMYAINTARWSACLQGDDRMVDWHRWTKVGQELAFPFQPVTRYHEEFEGYDHSVQTNTTDPRGVKQADVALLGFPFMWEMPDDVRRNDLEIYEAVTNPEGPAMTWSMYAIGWLDLGETERAAELFRRSYEPYIRQPFKIWTEVASGVGAVNFITGSGGFLQAVLFGYGGVRLRADHLLVKNTVLPPGATAITMKGLNYLGNSFDLHMTENTVNLTHTAVGQYNITLQYNDQEYDWGAAPGKSWTFDRVEFKLYSSTPSPCAPPSDNIDVNYDPLTTLTPTATPTTGRAAPLKVTALSVILSSVCFVLLR